MQLALGSRYAHRRGKTRKGSKKRGKGRKMRERIRKEKKDKRGRCGEENVAIDISEDR